MALSSSNYLLHVSKRVHICILHMLMYHSSSLNSQVFSA